jgi:hypothetical protein
MSEESQSEELTTEDLGLEIAYLRGALQAKEQECQQLMAERQLNAAQIDALTRAFAENSVKVATLCAAVTQLLAGTVPLDLSGQKGMLS